MIKIIKYDIVNLISEVVSGIGVVGTLEVGACVIQVKNTPTPGWRAAIY